MKKLTVMIAVVAMAIASQAASIKWSYSSAANDATYADTTWYLISATALPTATDFENASDFQDWLGNQDYTGQNKVTTYNKATKKYANSMTATADSITSAKDYYIVIVNSDESKVQLSQLIDGSTAVFGELDTPITTSITTSGTWMDVAGGSSVPEPTTGVLVLIGMAGLALRRRHM